MQRKTRNRSDPSLRVRRDTHPTVRPLSLIVVQLVAILLRPPMAVQPPPSALLLMYWFVVSRGCGLVLLRGNDCVCVSHRKLIVIYEGRLTRRNDNDDEQDDDAHNEAHAHLHVLPPHLLAHTVGAPSEALGGHGEVIGLVL